MYRLKAGVSISFTNTFSEELKAAKEAGFECVDFDLTTFWRDREKEIELYRELDSGLESLDESGLRFNGAHISFGPFWDFSDEDETKRKDAVKRTEKIFQKCAAYKPRCYILHGSFEPVEERARGIKIKQLLTSLRELKNATAAAICIENLPRTCIGNTSEEICEIVDAADVKVCLDTNHFLFEKPEEAVLKISDRIFTTHISDYDFIDERHWLPYMGNIDWNKLVMNLNKIGYSGVFNFECGKYSYKERFNAYEKIFGGLGFE